jgi:hypothetical protein
MVLAGGEDKARRLDPAEINGHAIKDDYLWPYQILFEIHVAQEEAVYFGGHAGGIGAPVQQVVNFVFREIIFVKNLWRHVVINKDCRYMTIFKA